MGLIAETRIPACGVLGCYRPGCNKIIRPTERIKCVPPSIFS